MKITPNLFSRVCLALGLPLLLLLISLTAFSRSRAAGTLPNGAAGGDVTQTSAVLWARATTPGQVLFEYSPDPTFGSGVLSVTATVVDPLQPVKVEINALSPATTYFYQVTDAANATAAGQFQTAAPAGSHPGLRFGVSGDWTGSLAPYPSIANADERGLDFFVEHGDTIAAGSATTLQDFRLKHNQVYSTHLGLNSWADLRTSTSILATIDDNEIRNDFAGGMPAADDPRFPETTGLINDAALYENGLQAFQEYNPLRNEFYGATGDPTTANERRLYRTNRYGSDAAVFILDTRSFRDEQLPVPTNEIEAFQFLVNSLSQTDRTMLGAQQLADLKADLLQAQNDGLTWKFVLTPDPIQNLGLFKAHDRWEGYGAERTDLLHFINQNNIDNVVFVAAGLHGTIVNNLTYQFSFPGAHNQTDAFEIVVGPVAIDPPFGPAVIALAYDAGVIDDNDVAEYESLDRTGKDAYVRQLVDSLMTPSPLNYDPIGLEGSSIEATLIQGSYVAVHTYGWTEFEIEPTTQALTVTTYGIEPYTSADLTPPADDVISRTAEIVSQFVVTPKNVPQLALTKSARPAAGTTLTPGRRITYTLTVTNNGSPATNLLLTDPIPTGAVHVPNSQTTTMGLASFDGSRIIISLADFPAGATLTATFQVTVTAAAPATITNTAVITSDQTGLLTGNLVSHAVQESGSASSTATYLPLVLKDAW